MIRGAVAAWFVCCLVPSVAQAGQDDDWPMFGRDARGTRHNRGERKLTPWNVGQLRQLWRVPTPAPVTGTAAVVDDKVFVGDWAGNFYKLRANNGKKLWTTQVLAPISASALVAGNRVVIGDQAGFIYGLDKNTGNIAWQMRPDPHPMTAIWSSATRVKQHVAIGVSSHEEEAALDPTYPCCTFRGSAILLNPRNGNVIWQTYFVTEAEAAAGASGATAVSSPVFDEDLDLVYIATNNNYSYPANDKSDAIIALDARTGAIRWKNQRIVGDVSNFAIPWEPGIDAGFIDSPQIYRLANGRKVVSAGAKNGQYWTLDAATGETLSERQVQVGGQVGGLFADAATAYGIVFTNGSDWPAPFDTSVLPIAGLITALTDDNQSVLWQKSTPGSANVSGLAVANGVLYFASCNPGTGDRTNDFGTLYAVNVLTGNTLAQKTLSHCSTSGPAISNGRVILGEGSMFMLGGLDQGGIVAFGR